MTSSTIFLVVIIALWIIPLCSAYPDNYLCSPGWSYLPETGACYGVEKLPARVAWETGETYCQSHGGHLATFHNEEEFNHVLSYFYTAWDNMWVGYFSMDEGQTWQSGDGKGVDPFKYGNWCSNGYPIKFAGKHCLGLGSVQGNQHCFHNQACAKTYAMRVICKKQIF